MVMTDGQPLPVFFYSSKYNIPLPDHVFPAVKYQMIYNELKKSKEFRNHLFIEPEAVTIDQVLSVHDKRYIKDLSSLKMTDRVSTSELPLTAEIVSAFHIASGGTMAAARQCLKYGLAMNIGGGFHHAFADHAEGFCYLNDVAIAIRVLQKEKQIEKALVIDLDVHQGNGTARIFEKDKTVFTFSMHEENNYPLKQKGSLDIGLETGCKDKEYLEILETQLTVIQSFRPDIVFFLAGVDCYEDDKLGGLALTANGLLLRDKITYEFCRYLPTVIVLAGGYAYNEQDTVNLHLQTCRVFAGLE